MHLLARNDNTVTPYRLLANACSALKKLLDSYRLTAATEREKGTYFEELILCYLRNEATYRDLYSDVWMYRDWAKLQGLDGHDTGIDLVAKTSTGEYHAIQCKLYDEDYRLQKGDIDSFFTASGKKPFTYRIIASGRRKAILRCTVLPCVPTAMWAKSARRMTIRFKLSRTNCVTLPPPNQSGWRLK